MCLCPPNIQDSYLWGVLRQLTCISSRPQLGPEEPKANGALGLRVQGSWRRGGCLSAVFFFPVPDIEDVKLHETLATQINPPRPVPPTPSTPSSHEP